jgi:2,4-dienoyl-CoA reductase-like NADH-dependent reductase (Old Yellow Enzyme family)/thioredoxin reductase
MSDDKGYVTEAGIGTYEALAAGGFGAVCVGATCVRWDGLINERMFGLYDDTYIISHRQMVDVIHKNGALAGIQLFYGGLIPGLGTTVPLEPGKGWIPGTVSWGPSGKYPIGNKEPGVLTTEDYRELVEAYGQAARRAKEAGYDYISYHFCHGSLPHVTLSHLENSGRDDEYADHFLFCEQIIKRAQELCGKDYPQIPRMCCDENYEGGYDVDYFVEHYAPRLHALGIDAIDATFGSMLPAKSRDPELPSGDVIGGGFYVPNMVALPYVERLRAGLKAKGIDMPLMGSCNINTPEQMRTMIKDDAADFFASCRLSLDDPDFPRKIAEGREEEIRKSTRTGASLLQGNIFNKGIAGSAQNPAIGRDREFRLQRAVSPKKVMIVGGGSGGMEYAITAHQVGHDVTIWEKDNELGGVMMWAGNYKTLPNMEQIRYQPDWHRLMVKKEGIEVRTGVEVTRDIILAEKPDVLVVAMGAIHALPEISGLAAALKSGAAVLLDDVLKTEQSKLAEGPVVVLGATDGIELALDLAQQGRDVRLLDINNTFTPASYIGSRYKYVQMWMEKVGLKVESGVKVEGVEPGCITITRDGKSETIKCGTLVIAPSRVAYDPLSAELFGTGIAVQVIGDSRKPRSYGNSIHEAAYLSRRI